MKLEISTSINFVTERMENTLATLLISIPCPIIMKRRPYHPAAATTATTKARSHKTFLCAFPASSPLPDWESAIPEGKGLPVVLQIKVTPDAKAVTEKFNLNLTDCPSCKGPEYACACDHGKEDGHEGHDH